jgi:uncharacterized protein YndB with AHSA1/START domain
MAQMFGKRIQGVSDDAIKAKTGKKWEEWFKLLDKAGARMMDHREIARYIRQNFDLTAWWAQTLSVGYEQDRGIRHKRQRGTTYAMDRSKTLAAPLAAVWTAWDDPETRGRWLPEATFEVRSATTHKVIHLNWPDGTRVTAAFSEKDGKTKVVVTHAKLEANADATRMHTYWSEALARLKAIVES